MADRIQEENAPVQPVVQPEAPVGMPAILDLAAGTGKLTRRLAGRFATVTAVEPLDAMRAVLEAGIPFVRALRGTAEAAVSAWRRLANGNR